MKNKIITLFVLIIISGFTLSHLPQERALIIGTWTSQDDNNWKLIFNSDGKCMDYYEGIPDKTYNYFIAEETASNGVVFSYLKLVNVHDSSDEYNYEINSLTENRLALNYLGNLNEKLLLFEKQ